jgi:CHASE3 domain sensor protein
MPGAIIFGLMIGATVFGLIIGYIIGSVIESERSRREIQELKRIRSTSANKLTSAYEQIERLKQKNLDLLKKIKLMTNDC